MQCVNLYLINVQKCRCVLTTVTLAERHANEVMVKAYGGRRVYVYKKYNLSRSRSLT